MNLTELGCANVNEKRKKTSSTFAKALEELLLEKTT
jgi:hypothetical protein